MNNIPAPVQSVPKVPASAKRCPWDLGTSSPTGTTPRRGGTGGTVPRTPCLAGQLPSRVGDAMTVNGNGKHHGKAPSNVLRIKDFQGRGGLPIRCARAE